MNNRFIFHIDANAAYLSWEAVDQLKKGNTVDLRTIPAVIGGDEDKRKGIVLAKSMPCSKYEIKTGDTIYSARQKCPHIMVVAPNFDLYSFNSQAMEEILLNYSPDVEPYSIDEMFIDMSCTCKNKESAIEAADQIRLDIFKSLGFTVSVGVSSNKLLAKMATDLRKPNFTNRLFPSEIDILWDLPVEKLFMVGRKTAPKLHNLGIRTVKDLACFDLTVLEAHCKSHGRLIWEYANGIDDTPVKTEKQDEKGIGNSTTTPSDISTYEDAHMVFLSLSEKVGSRLRKRNFYTKVVAISIVNNDFNHQSKQITLETAIHHTNDIYAISKKLFHELWDHTPLRQLGIRLGQLENKQIEQLSLFDFPDTNNLLRQKTHANQVNLTQSIDSIRKKYGNNTLHAARFVNAFIGPMTGGTGNKEEYLHMRSHL